MKEKLFRSQTANQNEKKKKKMTRNVNDKNTPNDTEVPIQANPYEKEVSV